MLFDDLVGNLRDIIGKWWGDHLHTPKDGLDAFPKAFLKKNSSKWNPDVDLSKNILFGIKVEKVEKITDKKTEKVLVKVHGRNMDTGEVHVFAGDAVFLTVTLPILRQMDVPLREDQRSAIANISYAASTKVMLQCKTRFWQKDVGQGGFSKTDMMIGQLHYPDYDGSGIPDDDRGILMVYTWGKDAVAFGAQTEQEAIRSAVSEIAKIHPEIIHEFEVGRVQAWGSDPSAQSAFVNLRPYEYIDSMDCLMKPAPPIYIAGEATSWANGWMQGAIFSSLKQCALFQLNEMDSTRRVQPFVLGELSKDGVLQ